MSGKYSSEEIDLCLTCFALEGGRKRQVEKLLDEAELDVPVSTVRNWAYNVHKERYAQISLEVEEQVRTKLKDDYHRLAKMSTKLSEDALARISADLTARDAELEAVDAALERLGEIADDDKETLKLRRDLWELRDRLRVDLKDLAKLLHESGVVGGVATDKLQVLTGRPTQIVEHDFTEINRALEGKGVRLVLGEGQPDPPKKVPNLAESNGDGS